MSKFDYPSRYYADDKDVCDLLSEPKFNSRTLLRFARARGIFISSELSREALIEYISQLPFSWRDLMNLIKSLETAEKEEHITTVRIQTGVSVEQFQNALKQVQQNRGQLNSEVYQINGTLDGAAALVKYRELDHRSTRVLQWTDHNLEIQGRKIDSGFEVRYSATERGQNIVDVLVDKLAADEKKEKKVDTINLGGVTDSAKRTQFFKSIVYGMDGLRPENVKDVKLNRIIKDAEGNTLVETEDLTVNGGSDDGEAEATESPAAVVKRTTLSGDSLFQAPEFHEFCNQGFFVSRVIWTAVEKEGQARKFELESEFNDAERCDRFSYRLRGLWERGDDGELALRKSAIGLADRRMLAEKIEVAAYAAMSEATATPAVAAEDEAASQEKEV